MTTIRDLKNRLALEEVLPEGRQMYHAETLRQIGDMNVLGISGGRFIRTLTSLLMPVAKGYWVTVTLAPDDTYTVQRVFIRSGKASVKLKMEGVYADQVSNDAFMASLYS
jgi:hypothetical protein